MSFFFDVWTKKGFVLASDVRLVVNDNAWYAHKIQPAISNSKVNCAVATCGDFCEQCVKFFIEACARKDTLREIAEVFAESWTRRFAGTAEFSSVHLVGFERIPESDDFVPQVWFWSNWTGDGFHTEEILKKQLDSFSNAIAFNNHLPQKIKQETGVFKASSLREERKLVLDYLEKTEPMFSWNGDVRFWGSAGHSVASAMGLLGREKTPWDLDEISKVTTVCLRFLTEIGSFLQRSTVGLSPDEECDVLIVRPTGTEKAAWSDLPDRENVWEQGGFA